MNWQHELGQLDADVAAGAVSNREYHAKRAELLAEAAAGTGTARSVAGSTEPTPPGAHGESVTAGDLLATTRPTMAPSPADNRATESIEYPHVTPTRETSPREREAQATPPTLMYAAQAPSGTPRPSKTPPQHYVRSDTSSGTSNETSSATSTTEPLTHRPDSAVSRRRVATVLFLALGVVTALVVVGGALGWTNDIGGELIAGNATPSEPGPPGTDDLLERLPTLPGTANPHSGTMSPEDGVRHELYAPKEADALAANGVEQVTWVGSAHADTSFVVLAAATGDADQAAATTEAMAELAGPELAGPEVDDGRPFAEHPRLELRGHNDPDSSAYHVIYISGDYAVRIGVTASSGRAPTLRAQLADVTREVTAVLPPDTE